MTPDELSDELERIATARDFTVQAADLMDRWSSADVGVEAVDPVLKFMEVHPSIDFGAPGPLVHFVERFYRKGYEQRLIASVKRRPTAATVSMLNSMINGAQEVEERRSFIRVLSEVILSPMADKNTLDRTKRYLERFNSLGTM